MRNEYKASIMSISHSDAKDSMNMDTYLENFLSIKTKKRKTPKYDRMRMGLSN
jgi:hypothetical protein